MDKITVTENGGILELDSATRTIILDAEEANAVYWFIKEKYFNSFLLETIDNVLEDNEIDLSEYPGTKAEFIDEVKESLENNPRFYGCGCIEDATEAQIEDATIDTAESYNLI